MKKTKVSAKKVVEFDCLFTLKLVYGYLKPHLKVWSKKTQRFFNRLFLKLAYFLEALINLPFEFFVVLTIKVRQVLFKRILSYLDMNYADLEFCESLCKIPSTPSLKPNYDMFNIRTLYAVASLEGVKSYKKYSKSDLLQLLNNKI